MKNILLPIICLIVLCIPVTANGQNHGKIVVKTALVNWRKDVVADPLLDPVTLKEFTDQYETHYKLWQAKAKEMGGSKKMQKKGWALDKSRWIPAWDPSPYKPEF